MTPRDVRSALLSAPVPDELEAQRRAWAVVRAAYAEREPVRRPRRLRPLIALAVVAALVAAALSPPGRAVGDWIRDRVAGRSRPSPRSSGCPRPGSSSSSPSAGRGSSGRTDPSACSAPTRTIVLAQRALRRRHAGRRVVALEPDGDPRWSVTRPPRSPTRAGRPARASASPIGRARRSASSPATERATGSWPRAWPRSRRPGNRSRPDSARVRGRRRPRPRGRGRREELWSADPGAPREARVVARRPRPARRHERAAPPALPAGRPPGRRRSRRRGARRARRRVRPGTRRVAYSAFDAESRRGIVVLGEERLQRVEGRISDLAFSPDGRWLLAGWPEADQLLFLRLPGVGRIVAVDDVRREFDPAARRSASSRASRAGAAAPDRA